MANKYAFVRTEDAPQLPPPPSEQGVWGWLWQNIFSSMANFSSIGAGILSIIMALLTVTFGYLLITGAWALIDFTILSATFSDPEGLKGDACAANHGACWPMIAEWGYGFTFGNEYPREETWRVSVSYGLLVLGLIWVLFERMPARKLGVVFLLFIYPMIAFVLLNGTPVEKGVTPLSALLKDAAIPIAVGLGLVILTTLLRKRDGGALSKVMALVLLAASLLVLYWLGTIVLTGIGAVNDMLANDSFVSVLVFGLILISLAIGAAALPLAILLFTLSEYRDGRLDMAMVGIAPLFLIIGGLLVAYNLMPVATGLLDTALGLETVSTSKWGGLLVTLVVALVGITASLPVGIILALGRQSNAPFIKWTCIVFIEVVRGIPLISVLFFASAMLPYFLEPGVDFNKLLRALIGVMLFASAYMAEVVRGGLQAMPSGQMEGGQSLGLSYWQNMRLIILPQALKIVIPGIVNTFIGLFKDTTLVLIISLFDLLGMLQLRVLKDTDWYSAGEGGIITGYLFVGAVFWIFCFGMSRYSVHVERKLDYGHR